VFVQAIRRGPTILHGWEPGHYLLLWRALQGLAGPYQNRAGRLVRPDKKTALYRLLWPALNALGGFPAVGLQFSGCQSPCRYQHLRILNQTATSREPIIF